MLDGGLDDIESATLKPGTGYSQSSLSSAESPRSGGSSGGPAPLRGETVTLTITKADASSPVGLALGEARDGRSIVVQGVERGSCYSGRARRRRGLSFPIVARQRRALSP